MGAGATGRPGIDHPGCRVVVDNALVGVAVGDKTRIWVCLAQRTMIRFLKSVHMTVFDCEDSAREANLSAVGQGSDDITLGSCPELSAVVVAGDGDHLAKLGLQGVKDACAAYVAGVNGNIAALYEIRDGRVQPGVCIRDDSYAYRLAAVGGLGAVDHASVGLYGLPAPAPSSEYFNSSSASLRRLASSSRHCAQIDCALKSAAALAFSQFHPWRCPELCKC